MRQLMLQENDPTVRAFVQKIATIRTVKNSEDLMRQVGALPEKLIATVCFTVGATGLGTFIGQLLTSAKVDEDLKGIAYLSQFRHMLLESNAEVSSFRS